MYSVACRCGKIGGASNPSDHVEPGGLADAESIDFGIQLMSMLKLILQSAINAESILSALIFTQQLWMQTHFFCRFYRNLI